MGYVCGKKYSLSLQKLNMIEYWTMLNLRHQHILIFATRFIRPVRRRPKRQLDDYDKSPIFDSIVPVEGNVCSHKNGCDAFLIKVIEFVFVFQRIALINGSNLILI